MMSKFFIEHPVLANVLAIVLVLIGAVSLYRLPVVRIPERRAADRAGDRQLSRRQRADRHRYVALPIEQQVNGVDGMLYMESTSAADGTYSLTVTFQIGTDPNIDQVLVQNRVQHRAGLAAGAGAGAGRQRPEEEHRDPADRDPRIRRTGKYDSLYMSNYATINLVNDAGAAARRRQRHGVRRRRHIRCASGWIRRSSIPSGWCRRT